MLNNIDPAQFEKGFEAGLNKMAEGLWHDLKFNIQHPLTSLKSFATDIPAKADGSGLDMGRFVNDHASGAGESFANGAINGLQKRIGYDPNKGFGDNAMGILQHNTGWDTSKGYGDNLTGMMTNHPLMSAGVGAAGLYGGYQLGKGLGLWGGDGNQQQHNDNEDLGPAPGPKNGFSAAYTTGATRSPQALQKAGSSFNVTDGVRMNVSDLTLPRAFSAPTAIGMNLVSMMAGDEQAPIQQEQPNEGINIAGQDTQAKELLAHPKMKAYIANLMKRTYQ